MIGEAQTIVDSGSKSVGDRFDKPKGNVVPQPLAPSRDIASFPLRRPYHRHARTQQLTG